MTSVRPLREGELAIVQWMLANAATDHIAASLIPTIPSLQVVGGCTCGCASVDFQSEDQQQQSRIIADATGMTIGGLQVGLILWGHAQAIVSLEVYDLDPGSSSELPVTQSLKAWTAANQ